MRHILRIIILIGVMIGLYYIFTPHLGTSPQLPVASSTLKTTDNSLSQEREILVANITEGQYISSPLTITGTAQGWYFEGSFPVTLLGADGSIIASSVATAKGDWMTIAPVEFQSVLEWTDNKEQTDGILLFKKDNPSGDPDRDRSFSIKVKLQN